MVQDIRIHTNDKPLKEVPRAELMSKLLRDTPTDFIFPGFVFYFDTVLQDMKKEDVVDEILQAKENENCISILDR